MNTIDYIYRFDPKNPSIKPSPPDAETARATLEDGNRMFAKWMESCRTSRVWAGEPCYVVQCNGLEVGMKRAIGETPEQAPFAVVVGCSDARVPTEMLFGQGFNDLFVIRVAGNVLGDVCLGSIEFALTALCDSVKVVVMLGHSGCGAVTGAVDCYLRPHEFWSKSFPPMLKTILQRIFVAVREAANGLKQVWGPDARLVPGYREALIDIAVCVNAAQAAFDLRQEVERAAKWEIEVLYGVFSLHNHQVSMPVNPRSPSRLKTSTWRTRRRTRESSTRSRFKWPNCSSRLRSGPPRGPQAATARPVKTVQRPTAVSSPIRFHTNSCFGRTIISARGDCRDGFSTREHARSPPSDWHGDRRKPSPRCSEATILGSRFKASEKAQHPVEHCQRMGRIAGDIQVDRQNTLDAVMDLGMVPEDPARDGTRADGDHDLRCRNCLVGLQERQFHVLGDRPGDDQAVGVTGRSDELDAESPHVEDDRAKDVQVGFGGVVAPGAHLAELERAAEQPAHLLLQGLRQIELPARSARSGPPGPWSPGGSPG